MHLKLCFHCNFVISYDTNIYLIINKRIKYMCCYGCKEITKFIIDSKLGNYYIYREKSVINVDKFKYSSYEIYDQNNIINKFVTINANGLCDVTISINGIVCSACIWLIERHIKNICGIYEIFINFSTSKAQITFDLSIIKLSEILKEIRKIGYNAYPYIFKIKETLDQIEYKNELKKLIIAGIGSMQIMMLSFALYIYDMDDIGISYWLFIRLFNFIIATLLIIFTSGKFIINAYKSLKLKTLTLDTIVSLSILIIYFFSMYNFFNKNDEVYFDSVCMFIFFLLISRFLEMRIRHFCTKLIYGLQKLIPNIVTIIKFSNFSIIKKVKKNIDDVFIDDILLVKMGEIIPLDGFILNDNCVIDESMLTGESVPVYKKKKDFVMGGCVNLSNILILKISSTSKNSFVTIIIQILEKMSSIKPKIIRITNKISNYFILFVLILVFFADIYWFFTDYTYILNVTIAMLTIACPCALALAVPIAITCSTNKLAKNGFLIIKEHVLETLLNITDIVFDKTGTLTVNYFLLKETKILANYTVNHVFNLAYSLEILSNHPISKIFIYNLILKKNKIYNISNYKEYINCGIEGIINNKKYRIGKLDFVKEFCSIDNKFDDYKLKDELCIFLVNEFEIIAIFYLINPLRYESFKIINELRSLNLNLHILTGDPSNSTNKIAKNLEILYFFKNASIQDKLIYIKKLQKKNLQVMMVGDGINDILAFKISQIAVAMGEGTDLAKISADVTLLNNNLLLLPDAIKISIKTNKIIKQNIVWAIFYNLIGLIISFFGFIEPYFSVFIMFFSSLLVVLNSLRLLKK
ncbi:MAG: heavy metal translocating P-type ATPase metal-binding domain-containing protein [Candidatus Azosocius agrarius]|nr:MAG: heavy metal translocating P-type ATPase metal-binding domain-containing protein [Gammaproteobacteria bacterium]